MLRAACASGIGRRPAHEDNFLLNGIILDAELQQRMSSVQIVQCETVCSTKVSLIAVSDGMGGHNAGEVASRFCVQKLAEAEQKLQDCQSLQEAVERISRQIVLINQELCRISRNDLSLSGMGATLVLFVSFESEYAIMNIGDSRAYGFSGGNLVQLTKDHTEGQRMLDLGILTRKELETFPARKNINRYFGYEDTGYVLQADVYYPAVKEGFIMLCSDGVSDALSEQTIAELLSEELEFYRTGEKEERSLFQRTGEKTTEQNRQKPGGLSLRRIVQKAADLRFRRIGKGDESRDSDSSRQKNAEQSLYQAGNREAERDFFGDGQKNAESGLHRICKKIVSMSSEFSYADNATVILIEL